MNFDFKLSTRLREGRFSKYELLSREIDHVTLRLKCSDMNLNASCLDMNHSTSCNLQPSEEVSQLFDVFIQSYVVSNGRVGFYTN